MKRAQLHQVIGCLFSDGQEGLARKLAVMAAEPEYKKYFMKKLEEMDVDTEEIDKLTEDQWDLIDKGWHSKEEDAEYENDQHDVGEKK